MPRDEVIRVALVLRAEIEIVPPGDGPFSFHGPPREVVRAAAMINPGFVKAVLIRTETARELLVRHIFVGLGKGRAKFWRVRVFAVVPFAEDTGAIAVGLEALGNGGLGLFQFATGIRPGADAKRMPPREQHRAGGRTHAPAHEVAQLDALLEQAVNVRRGNGSAMRAEVAPAEVVGQEIDDVRLCGGGGDGWAAKDAQ